MKSLKIRLKQQSPVCLSKSRTAQNIFYSYDYVPGSVLWGFFIHRYLKDQKQSQVHPDFFNDRIRFPNAYIQLAPYPEKQASRSLPLPLSLFACKTHPFTPQGDSDKGHDRADLLFTDRHLCRSQGCTSELRPLPSPYFLYDPRKEAESIYACRPQKVVEMHNKIAKSSQNTAEDSLFSYELLKEVSREFVGEILFTEEGPLPEFIRKFDGKELHLGKARTSGYGVFTFTIDKKGGDDGLDACFEREFGDHINLYLHSDVILADSFQRYRTVIHPQMLGLEEDIELTVSFTRALTIQGFNAKHQKTRIDHLAIHKGACFSYRLKPEADTALIKERIRTIEADGLGIRKNEGFGRVRFNRRSLDRLPIYDFQREASTLVDIKNEKKYVREIIDNNLISKGDINQLPAYSALAAVLEYTGKSRILAQIDDKSQKRRKHQWKHRDFAGKLKARIEKFDSEEELGQWLSAFKEYYYLLKSENKNG